MGISQMLMKLAEGMATSCWIFGITLLFSLPLGMVIAFGRMSKKRAGGQPHDPHRGQDEGHPAAHGQARCEAHHQGHQGKVREVNPPEEHTHA